MNYYIYGCSETGSRSHNEDSILIDHEVIHDGNYESTISAPFITAVCDGVGGENAGEIASELCLKHLSILDYNSNVNMNKTIMEIHNKIKKKGISAENAVNMQTTLCALAVDEEGKAVCINVGDSRMYRFVNENIRQISIDQSYGQFLYEHGKIDSMEDLEPEYRSAIISSVGSTQNDPEIVQTPLVSFFGEEPDDMIIIVSDGISDFVSEQEFEVGLSLDLPVSQKLDAIIRLAEMNGSTDNLSIIGIKPYIDDDELKTLTCEKTVEQTVNVEEILAQTEELGNILSFDVNEIIRTNEEKTEPETIDNVAEDLLKQAEESIKKLENMFNA